MYIVYEIRPKSDEEYKDVIDFFGGYLDFYNIEHRKFESEDPIMELKKNALNYKDGEEI